MSLDKVFESVDPSVELSYFGDVIVLSLLNRLEQGFGDALQGVRVEIGAADRGEMGLSATVCRDGMGIGDGKREEGM